ncbi:conjugative transfer ATPase [Psychromonas sp. B3M02]|nr:conjugative transfer ATPase [Psychromonas sp. B3M02]
MKDGTWEFGKKLFKAFTVNAYRKVPKVGHLSAERNHSDKFFAVFDKFPTGTMTNITVTIAPSSFIKSKIDKIKNSSKGGSSESKQSKIQAESALDAIESGDHLYPVTTTFFIKGNDKKDLNSNIRTIKSLLMNNDIHLIDSRDDEIPLNQFCTNLPFCYDFKNDEYDMRSRLLFSSQISNLLPLYGRSRGTGNPGLIFFNRGAEDFSFDILKDRSSNAFGAILGPPGSGKSALLVYMIWMWAAIARPRFFILEKGDSFKLLGQYLSKMDMSVNRVSLKPNGKISLPPFANATKMIDEKENPKPIIDDEDDNEARDYLGEMELLARVMITGGDKIEEDELRAEHKVSIREAINIAAKKLYFENKENSEKDKIVRPSDVIEELNLLSKNAPNGSAEKDKLRSMAKSMSRYSEGLEGNIFNSPGEPLPEVDVTIMDFGLFAQEGYEGQLALSFMTQMQQIISIAERDQYSGRPIIVIGDESHLFLKNELLAPYVVKIGKMMRKLDTWPWFATQNLEDWANDSKKMLSMFEWFIAMACPKEEIEQISKFRDIDDNQKSLLLSCHKMRGLYTEGVVLSKTMPPSLFRSIPPSFALALAMTDPNEKSARKKLMDLHGISELDAVEMISEQIKQKRKAI